MGYRSRVPPAAWAAARRDYEDGLATKAGIAKRLGLSRSTVHEKIQRENWGTADDAPPPAIAEIEDRLNKLAFAILKGIESLEGRNRVLEARARVLADADVGLAELAVRQDLLDRSTGSLSQILKMTNEFTRLLAFGAKTAAKAREDETDAKESYEAFQLRFLGKFDAAGAENPVGRLERGGQEDAGEIVGFLGA